VRCFGSCVWHGHECQDDQRRVPLSDCAASRSSKALRRRRRRPETLCVEQHVQREVASRMKRCSVTVCSLPPVITIFVRSCITVQACRTEGAGIVTHALTLGKHAIQATSQSYTLNTQPEDKYILCPRERSDCSFTRPCARIRAITLQTLPTSLAAQST
jgi:hypothetical protein